MRPLTHVPPRLPHAAAPLRRFRGDPAVASRRSEGGTRHG